MNIENAVVFVTGANRGVGLHLVKALKARNAGKIYAASRSGECPEQGVVNIALDITDPVQVEIAARLAPDIAILINNAGVNYNAPLLNPSDLTYASDEIAVNYFGTLSMCRAFAPLLGANGGGVLVNIASVAGLVSFPVMGGACASKAALISLTQSVRGQLAQQGTHVLLVMPGVVDTEMSKHIQADKASPADVANAIFDAIGAGSEELYPDLMAQAIAQQLAVDSKATEKHLAMYLP